MDRCHLDRADGPRGTRHSMETTSERFNISCIRLSDLIWCAASQLPLVSTHDVPSKSDGEGLVSGSWAYKGIRTDWCYKSLVASAFSLVLRSLLLHLLLLVLHGLDEQFVGLACLGPEVLVLRQQQLEVDSRLIEEHTSDGRCETIAILVVDRLVNVVTDEVISFITLQIVELSHVHWRELHRGLLLRHLWLLRWHHDLLLRRLLTHLLLRRLLAHLLFRHAHLHVLVLASHLTIVVVLLVLHLLVIVVFWVSSVPVVAAHRLHAASAASWTATTSLESGTTTVVLVAIVGVVALSWTHETSLHSRTALSRSVLQLDHVDQLGDVVDVLVPDRVLSLVLRLPEVDFQRLCLVGEKTDDLIKELDCLLGLLDALV